MDRKPSLWFCVLTFLGLMACGSVQAEKQTIGNRGVIVHSPNRLAGTPAPLVIALHGGLGNAVQFQRSLNLNRQANRLGFRVVYPQGTRVEVTWAPYGRVWNAGSCCGTAMRQKVDDVAFIEAVVASFRERGFVTRVVAVGHSNGAMMALRVACDAPGTFESVVAIAGPLLTKQCRPQAQLSVTHLHGSADKVVPVSGRQNLQAPSQRDFPPLNRSVATLRKAGARVQVEIVEASHYLGSLNRALRRKKGISLPEYVADTLLR